MEVLDRGLQENNDFNKGFTRGNIISKKVNLAKVLEKGEEHLFDGMSEEDKCFFFDYGVAPKKSAPFQYIHHAFMEIAKKYPDVIAAKHQDLEISYGDLDYYSDRLAQQLIAQGVTCGDRVGLFLQRSFPMLIGMLAILKVGAVYVPQDARISPASQLNHIVEEADIKVVLTQRSTLSYIPVDILPKTQVIESCISELQNVPVALEHFPALQSFSGNNNCFILFTSGTTGKPNGVKITHKNLCNIILNPVASLGIKVGTKVSQILNIAFDMAAWEIWGCLSHGGTLIIREKSIQAAAQEAEVIIATPTILGGIDSGLCSSVKAVAVAGEPCPKPLADEWAKKCHFHNSCGPTETTIINTIKRYKGGCDELTIGKPIANTSVYILDENLRPCPIGEVGEMWAGGHCVSSGYLNNDALNKDRYKPDPFREGDYKMFRTRDLGRWTKSGELEHMGRTDDQIKIRGFRVELDSISTIVEQYTPCQKAITLKADDTQLVTFVLSGIADLTIVQDAVKKYLPYYCIPSQVIRLSEFPMTDRGKVDKRRLLAIFRETESLINSGKKQSAQMTPSSQADLSGYSETSQPVTQLTEGA